MLEVSPPPPTPLSFLGLHFERRKVLSVYGDQLEQDLSGLRDQLNGTNYEDASISGESDLRW
jgi:hypothetical protein